MSIARIADIRRPEAGGLEGVPRVPSWVAELLTGAPVVYGATFSTTHCGLGVNVETRASGALALVSLSADGASELSSLAFQRLACAMYAQARSALRRLSASHEPVRIWNFIPKIRTQCGEHLDRYMVFNAGRFAALFDWYTGSDVLSASVATATGVGHDGDDLQLHVLASRSRGIPVENPLQTPSYRYSSTYGPLPPCFARATKCVGVAGLPTLLVGGTASVKGERSLHAGDVAQQTNETLANLRALVEASGIAEAAGDGLSRFGSLRVYVAHPDHLCVVQDRLEEAFSHLSGDAIEWVRADICRPELLIEIEGTCG